jgi:Fe-S oxidoreductase
MNGSLIVSWNQLLSFSPLLAKTRAAEAVFWPGCAAMKLGARLIEKTYAALREGLPGLGFSSWCCGAPTLAVGAGAQKTRRAAQLQGYFRENGVQTVYTLCPNCQRTLARESGARALSAWPPLAGYAESHSLAAAAFGGAAYRLHDPCASREDADSQAAARRILAARGVSCAEFARHGAQTQCCGRRDMLFLTRPAAAQKMLDARLDEAGSAPILTYCESCVEAFRGAGRESFHLLEVLFNRKAPRTFANRVANARPPEAPHA